MKVKTGVCQAITPVHSKRVFRNRRIYAFKFQKYLAKAAIIQHECSRITLLHIFRTPFPRNTFTSGRLLSYEALFFENLPNLM